MRGVHAIVAAEEGFGGFRRAMYGQVAEIDFCFEVVERPGGYVPGLRLMAGVGAHGGVTLVHRIPRRILHSAHESSSSAHNESPVPNVRQQ